MPHAHTQAHRMACGMICRADATIGAVTACEVNDVLWHVPVWPACHINLSSRELASHCAAHCLLKYCNVYICGQSYNNSITKSTHTFNFTKHQNVFSCHHVRCFPTNISQGQTTTLFPAQATTPRYLPTMSSKTQCKLLSNQIQSLTINKRTNFYKQWGNGCRHYIIWQIM
jgi:hypothetical protein